ncbi:MAG: hypothetical protein AB1489_17595 [Acidobacteriota bacterium]
MRCHFCEQQVNLTGKVSRTEACPHCDRDLHICCNCLFMDPFAPNQCREPQAELVRDKEKSNFCEFFTPNQRQASGAASSTKSSPDEARKAFDNLFKK